MGHSINMRITTTTTTYVLFIVPDILLILWGIVVDPVDERIYNLLILYCEMREHEVAKFIVRKGRLQ